nr:MAG TPA: hypothetical protein [Caudoviricetes sp.]
MGGLVKAYEIIMNFVVLVIIIAIALWLVGGK